MRPDRSVEYGGQSINNSEFAKPDSEAFGRFLCGSDESILQGGK